MGHNENQLQTTHKKPSQKWASCLADNPKQQIEIAAFISQCFDSLNVYGKPAESIKASIKMHLLVLGEYPYPLIRKAFMQWIKTKSIIPTPADIAKSIEDENDQLLNYLERYRLMQNRGGGLAPDAINFIENSLGKDWKIYV